METNKLGRVSWSFYKIQIPEKEKNPAKAGPHHYETNIQPNLDVFVVVLNIEYLLNNMLDTKKLKK